ncbi:MAG: 2-oxoacid:acceptor oxidoreductase family protein [candidate division Zixibacteria bacterium]|nr:2-oxoacid:acceptor oxidoreductase family protein [candidate division Zixibacteria bacterium]
MTKLLDKIEVPQDRFELRLSGSGGQGMIFASVILGEAIGLAEGKNVVQSQSYGPEARGGASKSDVVVSANEIFYPKAMKLDLLLAMTQESMDKYYGDLKEDGILIVDTSLVTEIPTDKYYGFEFTRLARHEIGHIMVANVIALGAIAGATGIVSLESVTNAVIARAPKGTEDKNRKAVKLGYDEALKLKEKNK